MQKETFDIYYPNGDYRRYFGGYQGLCDVVRAWCENHNFRAYRGELETLEQKLTIKNYALMYIKEFIVMGETQIKDTIEIEKV